MVCKMEFMKERLSRSVPPFLEDTAFVDNSKIDHLIVADASGFQTACRALESRIDIDHASSNPRAGCQTERSIGETRVLAFANNRRKTIS